MRYWRNTKNFKDRRTWTETPTYTGDHPQTEMNSSTESQILMVVRQRPRAIEGSSSAFPAMKPGIQTNVIKIRSSWIRKIYKNKKIKRCPKCKTNIQKVTGWNHMTWSVCLHQFWWNWGWDYHPSHYSTFSLWSLEGDNRTDLLLMMLLLPLVLFFLPFTVLFAIRKILKEWMDFYWYDTISFILAFWIALPLGFLMQAFYPQVMLFLFTTWVRFQINKCKFRY